MPIIVPENIIIKEIPDEECWKIGDGESVYSFKYRITQTEYTKIKSLTINKEFDDAYPLIIGENLKLPNLESVEFIGGGSIPYFKRIRTRFDIHPKYTSLAYNRTNLHQIHDIIYNLSHIKHLTFRKENIKKLEDRFFDLNSLEELNFIYTQEIKVVPDRIKWLRNLKTFRLWQSNIDYLSPELFLLPKIEHIDLDYSQYTPTEEVLMAVKYYNSRHEEKFGFREG